MKKIMILMNLLLAGSFGLLHGQESRTGGIVAIGKLEKQNKLTIAKAYAASVRIWGFDTLKKVQTSSQFSGVVINKEGVILTVSHAIQPNKTYKVRFPDGREAMAVALGKIGFPEMQSRPDLGMMQLTTKDEWPFAGMGWSYSLKVDQPCISISYPETLNQLLPTIRYGKIKNVMNQWGFVESTCKMEPGDSGGPLFDAFGRVIGMHSRCEQAEDENYEVPIDQYRKYWRALQQALDYKELPAGTDELGEDLLSKKITTVPSLQGLATAFTGPAAINKSVLQLKSSKNGEAQMAYATLVEDHGRTFLVSKSSIVADQVSLNIDGKDIGIEVLARDITNDLVLLSAPDGAGNPVHLKPLRNNQAIEKSDLGTFLFSPVGNTYRVSILSSMLIDLPKKFSVGFIGAMANFKEGKVTITRTVPSSPAAEAGLERGDDIQKINDVDIKNGDQYNNEMQKSNPGDTLRIATSRNGVARMLKVIAKQRPPTGHAADNFDGGKSTRLDGFSNVVVHDAVIKPEECGGPVFDRNGKFYGLNIARFSRTSTIVMPVQQIIQLIEQLKTK